MTYIGRKEELARLSSEYACDGTFVVIDLKINAWTVHVFGNANVLCRMPYSYQE